MHSRHWVVMVALVLALGTIGPAAFADTNLLTNGSFSSPSNFSGWTQGGNTGATAVVGDGFDGFDSEDGDGFHAALGPVGSDGTLSHSFSDVSGQAYTFSFWYGSDGDQPNDFSALWDGTVLLSIVDGPSTDGEWLNFSVPETGTGSDSIEFIFRNDPGYEALDNVSVAGVSPIPEPSSFLLMGSGLLGLAGAVRRKFRN
jgi:hypothetical protein